MSTNTFVGNLTGDPELRYTQSGLAVANFTIADTERKWDEQKRAMVDAGTVFIRCSVWREFAEQVAASLKKGMRVVAVGKLKQRQYETDKGEKRTSIELVVDDIGPSLKWASAVVSRAQHGGGQATSAAQQSYEPAPIDDRSQAWATTSGYQDETPF